MPDGLDGRFAKFIKALPMNCGDKPRRDQATVFIFGPFLQIVKILHSQYTTIYDPNSRWPLPEYAQLVLKVNKRMFRPNFDENG